MRGFFFKIFLLAIPLAEAVSLIPRKSYHSALVAHGERLVRFKPGHVWFYEEEDQQVCAEYLKGKEVREDLREAMERCDRIEGMIWHSVDSGTEEGSHSYAFTHLEPNATYYIWLDTFPDPISLEKTVSKESELEEI